MGFHSKINTHTQTHTLREIKGNMSNLPLIHHTVVLTSFMKCNAKAIEHSTVFQIKILKTSLYLHC